ncbi:MAG: DUF1015 domain-containing protein [Gemmatimonadales bacterium]
MRQLSVPFRGERYTTTGQLSQLLSPPYDVLGPEQRRAYGERHPANIVHLILPDGTEQARYQSAVNVLNDWRAREVVAQDAEPAVYVVQQEFLTPDGVAHVRSGVIAAVAAEPYEGGRVRPHERTHRGPKEDRLALLTATRVQSEAIFLIARDERGHLRRRIEGVTRHEPHAVAALDDVLIRLWWVRGVQAEEIARATGDTLYIADGHHRYETATTAGTADPAAARLPALIVPAGDPGLVVLPTHRLVRGASPEVEAVRTMLARHFTVEERDAEWASAKLARDLEGPDVRCAVLVAGRLLVGRAPAAGRLAIAVIEAAVVEPLKAMTGGTVGYTPDVGTLLTAHAEGAIGVLVPATPLDAVLATADQGGVMPPKSTYFQPKVPSGLVWMPLAQDSA